MEGDGSISTNTDNKRISFVLTQKESKILYSIKDKLGFGTVRYDKEVKAYRFVVSGLPSLIILAHLFNGNLFLKHRIKQMDKWIKFLKAKDVPIANLSQKKVRISLYDGWLSGFADAEACFNVNITKRKANTLGFRTNLRFILDQNDKYALEKILDLFKKGHIYNRPDNLNAYRYTIDSLAGYSILVSYFYSFPLKTYKKEAFQKWKDIYEMMINKEHLNQEGLDMIQKLAKFVNDKTNLNE